MNKDELARRISKETGIVQEDTKQILKVMFLVIKHLMYKGNDITFRGFGKFEIRKTKPKPRYDFNTKKMTKTNPYYYPFFKVSKEFRKRLRRRN